MSQYKRWFQLQSDNYMKALKRIDTLEDENEFLKRAIEDIGQELTDEQLEVVIGGMKPRAFDRYVCDLLNGKLLKS